MGEFSISRTKENTRQYPLHRHSHWEIMYYTSGCGYLATAHKPIPFQEGTIILVPPGVLHGSVSEDGFVNVSVGGDFDRLLMAEQPVCLQDTPSREAGILARLIYENRTGNTAYLRALCSAYVQRLLQSMDSAQPVNRLVGELQTYIGENYSDPGLSLSAWMRRSGYAQDYMRAVFKKVTGLSPVQFLTKTRIDHACKLLEIYGRSLSVAQVAEACGFEDAAYFSKRFKQQTGCSPDSYRRYRQEALSSIG